MSKKKIFIIISVLVIVFSGVLIFASSKNPNSANDHSVLTSLANDSSSGNVLGATTNDESGSVNSIYKKISNTEAKGLIEDRKDDQHFKILDIRAPEEFESGNIDSSVNIDFYGEFEQEISKLNKNVAYLIYCRSGNRSGQAMETFIKQKFEEVYDLEGGYTAWLNL